MKTSGSSARAFAGRFLIALLVGALLMAAVVAGVDREVARKLDRIPKIDLVTAPIRPGGANYLLVGSDTRDFVTNDLEREAFVDDTIDLSEKNSDTIMVVHVEPKAERSFIVSFPRDLWVTIPGHGSSKINAAYGYGTQTLIDTMKQNFDIDINHFIELNFKSFVGLVDSLGKVKVYVPYPATDEKTYLDLPDAGCVELDGEQALQYVRSRYLEYKNPDTGQWVSADPIPDLGRISRQQEFMRRLAGLAVVKSLGNPFIANDVADRIVDGIKVDDAFDRSSVYELIDSFRTINPDDQSALEFVTLPSKGGPNQGQLQVLYPDNTNPIFDAVVQRLRTFDETPRPLPEPATIRVRVVNASGRPELGVAVQRQLEALGYPAVAVVERSTVRKDNTQVRYAPGVLDKAKRVLRYFDPLPGLDPEPAADLVAGTSPVDVEILLGKAFAGIVVPADALQVTDTVPVDPAVAVDPAVPTEAPPVDVEDVPAVDAPTVVSTLPASLPSPAPRNGC